MLPDGAREAAQAALEAAARPRGRSSRIARPAQRCFFTVLTRRKRVGKARTTKINSERSPVQ